MGRSKKKRASANRRQPSGPEARPGLPRPAWLALAIVALALLLTLDDRHPGIIADGRQIAWTAVAIVEVGEIGQARGRDFTWPRPAAGDSVSRFGMGMSLAQVPAAWLAPRVEATLGPGTSQPLFLVAPLLFVLLAAWGAGRAAWVLGASPAGVAAAVWLASLASPLGSYAALDLSEPLQASALALAFAWACAAVSPETEPALALRRAAAAGAMAGVAVLAKTSLIVVVPLALLPLAAPGSVVARVRRIAWTAGGFLPVAAVWLGFEIVRFGRPFTSYAGEGFTHPILDGLWRLLIGTNRGLVWCFPALVLVLAGAWSRRRKETARERLAWAGALSVLAGLVLLAAPWWAWHGVHGWGPRLLVPGVPLLAACAGLFVSRWTGWQRWALVGASLALNALPLLQHPAPVSRMQAFLEWPAAEPEVARGLAAYARREGPPGRFHIAPDQVLDRLPQASPALVYPWLLRATWTGDPAAAARALAAPPWLGARPDIRFTSPPAPEFARHLTRRARWNFWGRGFTPDDEDRVYGAVYDEGLYDQVVRAQQLRDGPRALALAQRLVTLAPSGKADAAVLEGYRLLGQRAQAAEYLSALPRERRVYPELNVVLALFERDAGNEPAARQLLQSVAEAFVGTPVERAIERPLAEWPPDLFSMTVLPVDQAGAR
jgi:hypothetical protein